MARPHKKIHRVQQMLSCYQQDLDFFNDHRGKVPLSTYLIEAGYQYAGDFSRTERMILEIQELKKKNQDLETKLMMANTAIERLQRKVALVASTQQNEDVDNEAIESIRLAWLERKRQEFQSAIDRRLVINWANLHKRYPELIFESPAAMEKWCRDHWDDKNENDHLKPKEALLIKA